MSAFAVTVSVELLRRGVAGVPMYCAVIEWMLPAICLSRNLQIPKSTRITNHSIPQRLGITMTFGA